MLGVWSCTAVDVLHNFYIFFLKSENDFFILSFLELWSCSGLDLLLDDWCSGLDLGLDWCPSMIIA